MIRFANWVLENDDWLSKAVVSITIILFLAVCVTVIVMGFIAFTEFVLAALGIFYLVSLFLLLMRYRKAK